jgi:tRNA(Ile2) C34 agmatinyltransferase TiaS
MYPHERSLVKRLEGKPFALVGVNSDRDRAALKKAMEKENITWRSFWDGGGTRGSVATRWAVRGWPTLYLIDHQGVIRKKWVGSPGDKVLDREIDRLVKEAEAKK